MVLKFFHNSTNLLVAFLMHHEMEFFLNNQIYPSHLKLIQWAQDRKELEFYIGASDSIAPPTVATNKVSLPTGRSFWSFKGALTPAVPTFEADSIVGYQFTLQRSTGVTLTPATV